MWKVHEMLIIVHGMGKMRIEFIAHPHHLEGKYLQMVHKMLLLSKKLLLFQEMSTKSMNCGQIEEYFMVTPLHDVK